MELQFEPGYLGTLHKGDTIPSRIIRQASGVDVRTDEYRLAQLAVRMAVERHFRIEGAIITTRCRGRDVVILTDAQASLCNHARGRSGVRKIRRALVAMADVDTLKLDQRERIEHENNLRGLTMVETATRRAARRAAQMEELANPT